MLLYAFGQGDTGLLEEALLYKVLMIDLKLD